MTILRHFVWHTTFYWHFKAQNDLYELSIHSDHSLAKIFAGALLYTNLQKKSLLWPECSTCLSQSIDIVSKSKLLISVSAVVTILSDAVPAEDRHSPAIRITVTHSDVTSSIVTHSDVMSSFVTRSEHPAEVHSSQESAEKTENLWK